MTDGVNYSGERADDMTLKDFDELMADAGGDDIAAPGDAPVSEVQATAEDDESQAAAAAAGDAAMAAADPTPVVGESAPDTSQDAETISQANGGLTDTSGQITNCWPALPSDESTGSTTGRNQPGAVQRNQTSE